MLPIPLFTLCVKGGPREEYIWVFRRRNVLHRDLSNAYG